MAAATQPKEDPHKRLVRIKPYNGKTNKTQSFTFQGFVYRAEGGWYEVDLSTAKYLATRRVGEDMPGDGENPTGALIFDVCTHEQARELEAEEAQRKANRSLTRERPATARRVTRVDPGTLTTADLPKPSGPKEDAPGDESDLEAEDLSEVVAQEEKAAAAPKRSSQPRSKKKSSEAAATK